ncbi:hypothetical protein AB1Y20_001770 [Prymnesium parvum]|uniref:Protein kinase domain-containing protein n=1 Tax=Prymnesium parvum TaxID=97485 RepID=A0AB34KC54_PRYPA
MGELLRDGDDPAPRASPRHGCTPPSASHPPSGGVAPPAPAVPLQSVELRAGGGGGVLRVSRVHGVAFDVHTASAVLLHSLELRVARHAGFLRRRVASLEPMRVYCTRGEPLPRAWDWRQWRCVGTQAIESDGASSPAIHVRFSPPIPIAAGCRRTLYCFSQLGIPAVTAPACAGAASAEAVSLRLLGAHRADVEWFQLNHKLTSPRTMPPLTTLAYSAVSADEAFDAAQRQFSEAIVSLEQLLHYRHIGMCNQALLAEWAPVPWTALTWPAESEQPLPSLQLLALPAAELPTTSCAAEPPVPPPADGASAASPLNAALGGMLTHPACEEMWRRYLSRFRGALWLYELGDIVRAAALCRVRAQRRLLLQWGRNSSFAPCSSCCVGRRHRTAVREAVRLLHTALKPSLDEEQLLRVLRAIEEAHADALLPHVSGFRQSHEYLAATRLLAATARPVRMGSFSLLRRMGRGSSATVYAARKEDTMALYALKVIDPRFKLKHVLMERYISEKVAATPFLCGLAYAFHAGPMLVLTLPLYAGGTLEVQLEERARSRGGLGVREVRWIAGQMILALQALHRLRCIHRDVKPHNILLRADGYYALGDFGLAARLDMKSDPEDDSATGEPSTLRSSRGGSRGQVRSKAGTRGYWAPEVILGQAQGETADWWSLGVVLFETASGVHPFKHRQANGECARHDDNLTEEELNDRTLHALIDFPPRLKKVSDPSVVDMLAMVSGLLERDPAARLGVNGAEQLCEHAFISGHLDLHLLAKGLLRAPWTPDATLVYAKDHIDFPSSVPDVPAATHAWCEHERWEYCCDDERFASELRELARKCSAELILTIDELVEDDKARGTEADTKRVVSRWTPTLQELAVRRKARARFWERTWDKALDPC